jgi:outer membrane protein assembly factor BamB
MAHHKTSVAANTPCTDGRHVFALWSSNDLAAFDLDGNLLWLRGLTYDYPNASNSLGMASSLALIDGTLITMIENDSESYSLGIDPATGINRWKLPRPKAANWTTPAAWQPEPSARPAALLQSSRGIAAVDPATGSTLWEYTDGASTTSSSTVANGIVFAPSHGITALKPASGQSSPGQLWRTRQISPATMSPLVMAGSIYTINGAGILTAASAETGGIRWKLRLAGPFSGSPIGDGARILVTNEKGLVQIVDATGEEGKLAGQLQLPLREEPAELILATPALLPGTVFIRTDGTLWRLDAK